MCRSARPKKSITSYRPGPSPASPFAWRVARGPLGHTRPRGVRAIVKHTRNSTCTTTRRKKDAEGSHTAHAPGHRDASNRRARDQRHFVACHTCASSCASSCATMLPSSTPLSPNIVVRRVRAGWRIASGPGRNCPRRCALRLRARSFLHSPTNPRPRLATAPPARSPARPHTAGPCSGR